MNTTLKEGLELGQEITALISKSNQVDIAIFPPSTHISTLKIILETSGIAIGSQTISNEESGAFTGEISAKIISNLGCSGTLIGHSERRQLFEESDTDLAKKCEQALANSLQIIFCVGETLDERQSQKTLTIIKNQLKNGLATVKEKINAENLIIAYEPVWAIGTGQVASPEEAQEVHAFIREFLAEWHSEDLSKNTRILYGGSVKPSNSKELLSQTDIDGALIGGASLSAQSFTDIIKTAQ